MVLSNKGDDQQHPSSYSSRLPTHLKFLFFLLLLCGFLLIDVVGSKGLSKKGVIFSGGKLYQQSEIDLIVFSASEDRDEQVVAMVQRAKREGKAVSVRGSGLSQGRQFLPPEGGYLFDLSQSHSYVFIPQDLHLDSDAMIVTVGAGTTWQKLQEELNQHGLALKIMQASNIFSVGGSISTNIHGWNHREGTLGSCLEQIRIVNHAGEILATSRSEHVDLFKSIIGGYGQFGVILDVSMRVDRNLWLKAEDSQLVPTDRYNQHYLENVKNNPKTRMHLYRLSIDPKKLLQEGIVVNYNEVWPVAKNEQPELVAEQPKGTLLDRMTLYFARKFAWTRQLYWHYEKTRLLDQSSDRFMTTNQVMRPKINAIFNQRAKQATWLQEFFLPPDKIHDFIQELSKILTANEVALLNATVRIVNKDEISHLPYAPDDRFALVLCFHQELNEEAVHKTHLWVHAAIESCLKNGGSYYLPYQHFATQEQFKRSYPSIATLKEKKAIYDPQNLFRTGFGDNYLFSTEDKLAKPLLELSNEDNRSKFRSFLTNILRTVDPDKFYLLYDDIAPSAPSYKFLYTELQRRLPKIQNGALRTQITQISSLQAIKHDWTEQAMYLLGEDVSKRTFNGVVEIGHPGRMLSCFKEKLKTTGEAVIVNDTDEGFTDKIQQGSFFSQPHDRFVKFDYAHVDTSMKGQLTDSHYDLISCFVGLHHFSEEQLEHFLTTIATSLRQNGVFMLMEHDVVDEETKHMAELAHSVFNIATGVDYDSEVGEVRNFQPISYWQKKLEEHGLYLEMPENVGNNNLRDPDASNNRMYKFVKKY